DIGWKWLIPSALINIGLTAIAATVLQGLNSATVLKTIEVIGPRLNLTMAGKFVAFGFGLVGVFITAALLARINWRSRDFNLKTQRRDIRLVNLPKGKPAVPVQ